LTADELRNLGVFWTGAANQVPEVFITRLHVRYDKAHFPEDLVFQETADRSNFQGRYVLRQPWTGGDSCAAAAAARSEILQRRGEEATRLASLTGWNISEIRKRMGLTPDGSVVPANWWERLWKK
jgi:hypothetical protein